MTSEISETEVKDLIARVQSGDLDNYLAVINKTISDRLAAARRTRTATDFGIGDRVVLNDLCGTRYLVGASATVVSKKRTKVVIRLDKPMGRFVRVGADGQPESSDITVPVTILDKI